MSEAAAKASPEEVFRAWAGGKTFAALGREYNMTPKRVHSICRDFAGSGGNAPSAAARRVGEIAIIQGVDHYLSTTPIYHNPSDLIGYKGLRIFDDMRRDDQIKAALQFKKMAVLSPGWIIKSPEGKPDDWEPTAFVRDQLNSIQGTLRNAILNFLTSLDYGWSLTEQIYEPVKTGKWRGKLGLKKLKVVSPQGIKFATDTHGNITAIKQETPEGDVDLPLWKFVHMANESRFSNPYGHSDLEAAYRPWWAKENAYRFLVILLEKFGIPPIIALYDKDKIQGKALDNLYDALVNMQDATAGVMPGLSEGKEVVKLWTPELAKQGASVFPVVMDKFNTDIARALLMPALLGLTPDDSTGSFARSRVMFDVFLMIVEFLQQEVSERAMSEQVIAPLVSYNFGLMPEEYPTFEFLPITDDLRQEVLEAWGDLVEKGVVKTTPDDEAHIRTLVDFPERATVESDPPMGQGKADDSDSDAAENDKPDDDKPKKKDNTRPFVERDLPYRHQSDSDRPEFEKKVDFARIFDRLETIERDARVMVSVALTDVRTRLVKWTEKNFNHELSVIGKLSDDLRGMPKVKAAVIEFMRAAYEAGRSEMATELAASAPKVNDALPAVIPQDALDFLDEKSLWITGVINNDLVNDAKQVLLRGIETGAGVTEVVEEITKLFLPWIMDPDKISDPDAARPVRLETTVRTVSTEAFNRGRIIQARNGLGNLLKGFEYSAILDSRTTDVCRRLDGRVFLEGDVSVERLAPPRHFRCRSILVAIVVGEEIDDKDVITAPEAAAALNLSGKGFGGPKNIVAAPVLDPIDLK